MRYFVVEWHRLGIENRLDATVCVCSSLHNGRKERVRRWGKTKDGGADRGKEMRIVFSYNERKRESGRERESCLCENIFGPGKHVAPSRFRKTRGKNRITTCARAKNIKNIRGEANVRCAEGKNKAERAEGLYRRCDEIWMVQPAKRSQGWSNAKNWSLESRFLGVTRFSTS